MAVKKFVFWVESEVSGMKIAFFFLSFLTQPGHTFWPQKAQIWDYLNRILVFNSLERQKLYYYQL